MTEIKPRSAADFGMTMTARAAERIKALRTAEGESTRLRLEVVGGGCSGFQYTFSLADHDNDDDLRIERDGATIVVDETSVSLLQGSEVDFHEGLDGSMFTVSNPNATASCGCGTSFAVG
ncbi:MAG TPA: iron-sulfur cluster insertion protein ErpA [Alphaproteobacteria bacterium]